MSVIRGHSHRISKKDESDQIFISQNKKMTGASSVIFDFLNTASLFAYLLDTGEIFINNQKNYESDKVRIERDLDIGRIFNKGENCLHQILLYDQIYLFIPTHFTTAFDFSILKKFNIEQIFTTPSKRTENKINVLRNSIIKYCHDIVINNKGLSLLKYISIYDDARMRQRMGNEVFRNLESNNLDLNNIINSVLDAEFSSYFNFEDTHYDIPYYNDLGINIQFYNYIQDVLEFIICSFDSLFYKDPIVFTKTDLQLNKITDINEKRDDVIVIFKKIIEEEFSYSPVLKTIADVERFKNDTNFEKFRINLNRYIEAIGDANYEVYSDLKNLVIESKEKLIKAGFFKPVKNITILTGKSLISNLVPFTGFAVSAFDIGSEIYTKKIIEKNNWIFLGTPWSS